MWQTLASTALPAPCWPARRPTAPFPTRAERGPDPGAVAARRPVRGLFGGPRRRPLRRRLHHAIALEHRLEVEAGAAYYDREHTAGTHLFEDLEEGVLEGDVLAPRDLEGFEVAFGDLEAGVRAHVHVGGRGRFQANKISESASAYASSPRSRRKMSSFVASLPGRFAFAMSAALPGGISWL